MNGEGMSKEELRWLSSIVSTESSDEDVILATLCIGLLHKYQNPARTIGFVSMMHDLFGISISEAQEFIGHGEYAIQEFARRPNQMKIAKAVRKYIVDLRGTTSDQ